MLAASLTWRETTDTMTTRTISLVIIGLIVCLLSGVAVAALFSGDISERSLSIVTIALAALGTVLTQLLLFIRVETVAEKATNVENRVANLHHDVLNGGLRDNVKRAISESEQDPAIRERRVENVAKGVSQDRHDKQNREAVEHGRTQLEARRSRRQQEEDSPS